MKEPSSREQAQPGPGNMLGATWGTQRQNWCGSGVGDGGVSGWEPVISMAVGQSLCPGCPRSAGEQTGARERAVRDSVPVISATPGCAWERGRRGFSFVSLLSSLAVLLPVPRPSCSSSRRLVGPPGFLSCPVPQAEVPSHSSTPTPWGETHSGGSRGHLWP